MDAHPKVVQLAESLPESNWKPLERLARYEIATEPRRKPQRIKEAIVRFKGYLNKKLVGESVAEFSYQPNKCGRSYRLVVVRKNISVQKGEMVLLEDIKYFFYITNHTNYCAEQIVALANKRCDQENVIEQLKNGVNAMRMPVDDLLSNWAYMVMSALGMESQSLVWITDAQSPTRAGITQDGVSSLPAPHCAVAGSDRAQRSADYLPDHGLQQVAQRLLRYLGVSSPDGACLK
jgi:hypothetical protein